MTGWGRILSRRGKEEELDHGNTELKKKMRVMTIVDVVDVVVYDAGDIQKTGCGKR